MKRLKDKADLFTPDPGEGIFAQASDLVRVDQNPARSRCIESRDQAKQGRFAAARSTGHSDKLTVGNFRGNIVEYSEVFGAGADGFGYIT